MLSENATCLQCNCSVSFSFDLTGDETHSKKWRRGILALILADCVHSGSMSSLTLLVKLALKSHENRGKTTQTAETIPLPQRHSYIYITGSQTMVHGPSVVCEVSEKRQPSINVSLGKQDHQTADHQRGWRMDHPQIQQLTKMLFSC